VARPIIRCVRPKGPHKDRRRKGPRRKALGNYALSSNVRRSNTANREKRITRKIAVAFALALLISSGAMAAEPTTSTQSLTDKLLHRQQKHAPNCRALGDPCGQE
jgi:hypothetical protein